MFDFPRAGFSAGAENTTKRQDRASSASRLLLLILASALALTGCATAGPLSPKARIVAFCNPAAHAVDLALAGIVLGVAAYGGIVGPAVELGTPRPRGQWDVPGVMCYNAINDQIDAAEASTGGSTKGE